ncbi:hypothetical protein [Actinocatenispora comari]|uniref:Iron-containing redox enzyme family protein n=1 Tax=Actinocatenispora comari TaxID=2807577 RepID=A0A8J4ACZ8_9ACTN|nr:hypothetical protein [Actinocatenispora comari]GIL27402.1 hypothetical protein NUM_26560 [Actinocatenispora comari]
MGQPERSDVDRVAAYNNQRQEQYRASRLCQLLVDDTVSEETKKATLPLLQPWSNAFQRMTTARVQAEASRIQTDPDPELLALAMEHWQEEVGHNDILKRSRGGGDQVVWDPVIEAGAAWFIEQFRTLPGMQRAMLAHLVLEAGSLVFSQAGVRAFPHDEYFTKHDEDDVEHLEMGYRLLRSRSDWSVEEMVTIMDRGWQIITLVSDRIAECAVRDTATA